MLKQVIQKTLKVTDGCHLYNYATMRNWFYLIVICFMAACNTSDKVGGNDVVQEESISPIFHAYFADESTRTFLDEFIRLRWTEGDLITLFEGKTRNKKYKFMGETGDNAGDFEEVKGGFGSGNDVDCYYAIYPYDSNTKLHEDGYITYTLPSEQTYADNTVGLGANVMVAKTEDLDDYDLSFRNVGGYLRLFLYGTDTTVKSITIQGHNNEPLAGKVKITPVYNGVPTSVMDDTATSSVTLNCPEGVTLGATESEAIPFWIVLPPTNFPDGFTITVNGYYGGTFTKSYNSNITINRNKYLSAMIDATIQTQQGLSVGKNGWNNGGSYEGSAE